MALLPWDQAYQSLWKRMSVAPEVARLSFRVTSATQQNTQASPPDGFILLEGAACSPAGPLNTYVCGDKHVCARVGGQRRAFSSPAARVVVGIKTRGRGENLSLLSEQIEGRMDASHRAGDGKCQIRPVGRGQASGLSHSRSHVFAFTVSHHVCEQASQQAELGGDGTGDPGERVLGLSGPGRAAPSCPSGKEWPPCSRNSEAQPLWPPLGPSVLIFCGCWNQGPQTFPSSRSWRLASQTRVGRAASFRGSEGVSVPGLSPSSGGLLAVLGFRWVGDASPGSLPSWSRDAPPVCASVSTFPLLVRTLVVLD